MILLADAHRHADEAEAGAALVHHAASVVEVFPVDVPVDNGFWGPTVSGFGGMGRESQSKRDFYKVVESLGGVGEKGPRTQPCSISPPPLENSDPGVTSGTPDVTGRALWAW